MKIIPNLSWEDYKALPELNASRAWLAMKSMRLYQANEQKASDATQFGVAVHYGALQPELVRQNIVSEPDFINGEPVNRRLKAHREHLEKWAEDHKDKIILDGDEMERMTGCLNALLEEANNPPPEDAVTVSDVMNLPGTEETVISEIEGRPAKGRLDKRGLTRFGKTIVDLKTTRSADPKDFRNDVYSLGYAFKAAWYVDLVKADAFLWLVVETKPPYSVALYNAEPFLELGRAQVKKAMERIKRAETENYYPGYTRGAESLWPTDWQRKLLEDGEM